MRFVHLCAFVLWQVKEITRGAVHEMVMTFDPRRHQHPAIYAIALRSCTDLEVTAVTASIAVTPGSQVLGIAPRVDDRPITIYVHALDLTRAEMEDEVAEIEDRLLRALRAPEKNGQSR